ncbi:Gag-pol fusion protein [Phytophthora cinnamomi]|uniref:Gag-pol fusion protein n=1 Tax=Phytophthora cinnamomi TaxID=4785 RepID=UPI003559C3E5|nr:Gag-pol fusion protein [Phytophthora cinnamomi]
MMSTVATVARKKSSEHSAAVRLAGGSNGENDDETSGGNSAANDETTLGGNLGVNDETTDGGNLGVNDEMMAVCARGLRERSAVPQMTGLVCVATREKGKSSDGMAKVVQWMDEDAGTRDEGRAARYVATVRPAMAAARYVRADHRQERRDDDAVGRRREDGRLTGEGGDRLRTGEGTASQSVRTTSPVTASTTATGPSERATVNACAASTARTPRLSTARTAAASMTVAATETKAALELDVTTDATNNATDGMAEWPAPSTTATVTVIEKEAQHGSTEAPSDETIASTTSTAT